MPRPRERPEAEGKRNSLGLTPPLLEANSVVQLLTTRRAVVTPLRLTDPICRDTDDDKIIGTALAGRCDCIVTGDKDLLDLRKAKGVRMVSHSDFWTLESQ